VQATGLGLLVLCAGYRLRAVGLNRPIKWSASQELVAIRYVVTAAWSVVWLPVSASQALAVRSQLLEFELSSHRLAMLVSKVAVSPHCQRSTVSMPQPS